ncbi:unnamed protein product [Prorocentrum cordatum]|uniref:AP2/ERF domain-containing protein n=1 Tax=Prorocentrum cordatum TaxID=2364126 RepID=A0ABN9SZI2_9DINO|nr:unnamed protein product [Polarella glacialis]
MPTSCGPRCAPQGHAVLGSMRRNPTILTACAPPAVSCPTPVPAPPAPANPWRRCSAVGSPHQLPRWRRHLGWPWPYRKAAPCRASSPPCHSSMTPRRSSQHRRRRRTPRRPPRAQKSCATAPVSPAAQLGRGALAVLCGCPEAAIPRTSTRNSTGGGTRGARSTRARGRAREDACQARKPAFDAFCGVEDAVMLHVSDSLPEAAPLLPRSTGCFVWLPSGCKAARFHAKFHWRRDTWGEANARAGESEDKCKARKRTFDAFCGVEDAVMLSLRPLPPVRPRSAGCFVWLPSGCKTARFHAKFHWRRDTWGEANARAGESEDACRARKPAFDAFCGVEDAEMLPVLAAPPEAESAASGEGGPLAPRLRTYEADDAVAA